MNNKLHKEYIEQMKALTKLKDEEEAHTKADKLLCEFLKELGYDQLVKTWEKVDKFYA